MIYLLEKSATHVRQMHPKTTQLTDCFMSTRKNAPHAITRWTWPVGIAAENTEHRDKQNLWIYVFFDRFSFHLSDM